MTDTTYGVTTDISSAGDILDLISKGRHVVFLDVRFSPKEQDLRSEYDIDHIAGAHYVNLATQLQGKGGGLAGARPLPDLADLQDNIKLWGIRPDTTVVVYTRGTPAAAARAWFVLKWAGHPDVHYLDGGLAAWISAGGATDTSAPVTGGGTFVITRTGQLPTLSAEDVADYVASGRSVFDARGEAGFRGDGSTRSGHIPGTRSLPATKLLDTNGFILSPGQIAEVLREKGIETDETIGVYCGGGVAGALETLALHSAGIDARLFVGSFSAWSADPLRPVAQGD
jgi:thiosulfate/3-mercaptopyruvate sulfurtransferase